ncbi:hypothetical protein LPU83_3556 [Rhizobium favelukesii]|uniref:Uncharacterized protein n=1 Tax=Rhizobium favelukesii TaxID=348824 RepID=W6RFT9_9HYPH|nr:hypothetical protein LPU83_3556 [Rhizobium favelukesii]
MHDVCLRLRCRVLARAEVSARVVSFTKRAAAKSAAEIKDGLSPDVAYLMETCAAGFIGVMR